MRDAAIQWTCSLCFDIKNFPEEERIKECLQIELILFSDPEKAAMAMLVSEESCMCRMADRTAVTADAAAMLFLL